jgi:hypothetical protein
MYLFIEQDNSLEHLSSVFTTTKLLNEFYFIPSTIEQFTYNTCVILSPCICRSAWLKRISTAPCRQYRNHCGINQNHIHRPRTCSTRRRIRLDVRGVDWSCRTHTVYTCNILACPNMHAIINNSFYQYTVLYTMHAAECKSYIGLHVSGKPLQRIEARGRSLYMYIVHAVLSYMHRPEPPILLTRCWICALYIRTSWERSVTVLNCTWWQWQMTHIFVYSIMVKITA